MATTKITYAASSDRTVTNLHGLAASATHVTGWESDAVDNTSNLYLDYLVSAKFTVESAGVTAGDIRMWIVAMLDDSTWPGGFDGTESAETTPLDDVNGTASGARLGAVAIVDTTASQVYYVSPFSVASLFGGICPAKFVIFVTNNTGTTLETSGNQVTIKGMYLTTV